MRLGHGSAASGARIRSIAQPKPLLELFDSLCLGELYLAFRRGSIEDVRSADFEEFHLLARLPGPFLRERVADDGTGIARHEASKPILSKQ